MNVDLPAPFGPRRPVIPGGTVTFTSFSPMTWPYHLETCSAVTTGLAADGAAVLPAAGAGAAPGAVADGTGTVTSPPPRRGRGARGSRSRRRPGRQSPAATPATAWRSAAS